jgi:hypothetical protein
MDTTPLLAFQELLRMGLLYITPLSCPSFKTGSIQSLWSVLIFISSQNLFKISRKVVIHRWASTTAPTAKWSVLDRLCAGAKLSQHVPWPSNEIRHNQFSIARPQRRKLVDAPLPCFFCHRASSLYEFSCICFATEGPPQGSQFLRLRNWLFPVQKLQLIDLSIPKHLLFGLHHHWSFVSRPSQFGQVMSGTRWERLLVAWSTKDFASFYYPASRNPLVVRRRI